MEDWVLGWVWCENILMDCQWADTLKIHMKQLLMPYKILYPYCNAGLFNAIYFYTMLFNPIRCNAKKMLCNSIWQLFLRHDSLDLLYLETWPRDLTRIDHWQQWSLENALEKQFREEKQCILILSQIVSGAHFFNQGNFYTGAWSNTSILPPLIEALQSI